MKDRPQTGHISWSPDYDTNKPKARKVDLHPVVRLGDYVHAAKYSDYDPADPWRIGFVVRIIETWKPHPKFPAEIRLTYIIGEQNGTWSDFREYSHAKKITAEEGRAFLESNPTGQEPPTENGGDYERTK